MAAGLPTAHHALAGLPVVPLAALFQIGFLAAAQPADKTLKPEPGLLIGEVIEVTSGDALTLMVDGKECAIRLAGIDAPEAGQPYGEASTKALHDQVWGKTVQILVQGKSEDERILGVVFSNGCVNTRLVREGWVWHYQKHSSSKALAEAERVAREEGRGVC